MCLEQAGRDEWSNMTWIAPVGVCFKDKDFIRRTNNHIFMGLFKFQVRLADG